MEPRDQWSGSGSIGNNLYKHGHIYHHDRNTILVNGHMRDSSGPTATREAILDATDKLLTRYGYKKMTIDDLAHEVGIGKGSVYLHFESKEDIVLSNIDRIVERIKKNLDNIADRTAEPAGKRLRKMLLERVLFRFDSVQHYTQGLNELLGVIRDKLLERRRRYFEEEARIIGRVVAQGQKAGEFKKGDPIELANALLSATNSLLPYSLSAYELGERDELERRTKRIAELMVKGMTC